MSKRCGKPKHHRRRSPTECSICGKIQAKTGDVYGQVHGMDYCLPCLSIVMATTGGEYNFDGISGEKIGHRKRKEQSPDESSKDYRGGNSPVC